MYIIVLWNSNLIKNLVMFNLFFNIFLDAGNAVSAKITTAGIGIAKSNPNDRKTLRNRK